MNENRISNTGAKPTRPSRKLMVILAAGLLVLGAGITATSVGVASAAADETFRQCSVALKAGASATRAAAATIGAADTALEGVKSVTLPGDGASGTGGTSTDFALRAGVEAVQAVAAVEASEGVPAAAAVVAIPARASGAENIADVIDARAESAAIKIPSKCTVRDQAAAISALTLKSNAATKTIGTSVKVLDADFSTFRVDEAARIAAEIEAARVAAAAEAARVVAVAAAEAARATAARATASHRPSGASPSRSGGSTAYGGGQGLNGSGSFNVGIPGPPALPPGVCLVSNGMGGFIKGETGPCN